MSGKMYVTKYIPLVIIIFCFFSVVAEYYIEVSMLKSIVAELRTWSIVMAAFMLIPASITSLLYHGQKIQRKQPEWFLSAWFILIFLVVSFVGVYFGPASNYYTWIWSNIVMAVYPTVQSTTAFFIVYAGLVAFRARNLEAAVLIIMSVFVMLGNMTVAEAIFPGIVTIKNWIMYAPQTAAVRGATITTAIGTIGFAVRVLLSRERGVTKIEME